MLAYGEPIRRRSSCGSAHWLAMGASILIATVGHRPGRSSTTPWRDVAAARREATPARGSAASTTSWSTSGTSTSSTTPSWSGRPCAWPARRASSTAGHRRHGQRLGRPDRAAEPAGGALRPRRRRRPGQRRRAGSSTPSATGAAASRPGRLRNYLMFLAVAVVGAVRGRLRLDPELVDSRIRARWRPTRPPVRGRPSRTGLRSGADLMSDDLLLSLLWFLPLAGSLVVLLIPQAGRAGDQGDVAGASRWRPSS